MGWSEEKGEGGCLFGNDLKRHWIRCSVKYHRYQLAETKLSHTSYKFNIHTVSLCCGWRWRAFPWSECFLKARRYCLISLHYKSRLTKFACLSMLLLLQDDAFLPCGAVVKTFSVKTGALTWLDMGMWVRHWCLMTYLMTFIMWQHQRSDSNFTASLENP